MKPLLFLLSLCLTSCSIRFDWPRHRVHLHVHGVHTPENLRELTVAVESIRLLPCDSTPAGYVFRFPELIPTAHAHGIGSPTHLTIPARIDFSSSTHLGWLEPPPNSYCELLINFGPADDDVLNDPGAEFEGLSLYAETTAEIIQTAIRADSRQQLPNRLDLPSDHDIELHIHMTLQPDTPDLSQPLENELWRAVLSNIQVEVIP